MRTGLVTKFLMAIAAGLTLLVVDASAGTEKKAQPTFNEFEIDQIFAFADWDNPPEAKPAGGDGEPRGDREMGSCPGREDHGGPVCRHLDRPQRGKEPRGPEMGERHGGMEPCDSKRNDGTPGNISDAHYQAIMDYLEREYPDELAEVRNLRQQAEEARKNSDVKFQTLFDKARAVIMERQKKFEQFGDLIRQYRETKDVRLLEQIKVRLSEFHAESLEDMKKEIKRGERSLQEIKKQYGECSARKDQEIARELKQIADGI